MTPTLPTTATVSASLRPTEPRSLEDTGLSLDLVTQLVIKSLHFAGELTGIELTRRLGLPFVALEQALEGLKRQRHCEIVGGALFGGPSYRYRITDAGRTRAMLFLENNHYSGVAPVPIGQYCEYMTRFAATAQKSATAPRVREAFNYLVLNQRMLDQLGPAINSGHSMFLYGPPGNGKTAIAQGISRLLPGCIAIPHAIEVEGQIVRLFDPVNHQEIADEPGDATGDPPDRRWAWCRRPLVMVGGELTLDALELAFSSSAGFYRAPVQLLANGGVLIVDDFGRQQVTPRELLNRWIVPLESRVDYLTLHTGQKFAMPFSVFVVFATNLRPSELVDEAFLRRIQYKVYADSPTADDFRTIFSNVCRDMSLPYDPSLVDFLLDSHYRRTGMGLRGCHPRDLIRQAMALCDYAGTPRTLSPELLAAACASYFVEEGAPPAR